METLARCLCERIAALHGARNLNILIGYMPLLRFVRLALHHAQAFNQRFLFIAAALFMLIAAAAMYAPVPAFAQSVLPEEQEPTRMRGPDAVYVGTPYDIISTMLQMAEVKQNDMVYDLGCGDARMLVLAALKYGARGIGYEIDPELVIRSRQNVSKNNVQDLVRIIQADIFTLDLSDVDVMPMYLHPDMIYRLIPQIEKMKPGSRLVLHEYGLPDIYIPDKKITVTSSEDNAERRLMLYTLPLKRE